MSEKPTCTSGPLHDKLKDCKPISCRELSGAARKDELDELLLKVQANSTWHRSRLLNAIMSRANKRSGKLYSFSEESRYNN